jgi:hypothetical protein
MTNFYGPENANVTYTVPAIKHYMGPDIPLWATPKYTPPDHRGGGFEAGKTGGLNATADIADNCNEVHAPQDNQLSCVRVCSRI